MLAEQDMLLEKINDERLAWHNKSECLNDVVVALSQDSLNEILKVSELRKNTPDNEFDVKSYDLTNTTEELSGIIRRFLDFGPGFTIIDLKSRDLDRDKSNTAILTVSNLLGRPIPQNATGLIVKELYDRGTRIEDQGRYSESRFGGNLHTDGAEIPPPVPKFLPLICVRKAKTGGAFVVGSAYTIHNKMLERHKEELKLLYQDFHWDRRGDLGENGEETFTKPIFTYKDGYLTFTYLRVYIDEGYKKLNRPMEEDKKRALDLLDGILEEEGVCLQRILEPGQIMISNNHYTIHGRTTFEDYQEPGRNRFLLRTWVLEK